MLSRAVKAVFAIISIIFLISCARPPKETPPELYWPFPPVKPRIKFVDLILGSIDVTGIRAGKFRQYLFGEEKEVAFVKPIFVAVRNDVMYVTDLRRVHVYDFDKKKFRLVSMVFGNATGVAVTSDGTLFVADSGKKEVFMLKPGAKRAIMLDRKGTFVSPGGLAVDDKFGKLIVPDAKKHTVRVYNLEGEFLFSIGKRGGGPGEFNFPYAAAVDGKGRIYVVDSGNFRVQIFDREGKFLKAFGTVGAVVGHFARPKGIALDSEGHIYVVDAAFGNFQIFDINGNVFLSVGVNGSEPGKFSLPIGIAIDENDKVYVVDQMNKRIQIFQYLKYPDEN